MADQTPVLHILTLGPSEVRLGEHLVSCKNLIPGFFSRKLGYPALASIIGRMEPSLSLELNNIWVGSSSNTFSPPFLFPDYFITI